MFVSVHHPLRCTHYVSNEWYGAGLGGLRRHVQVGLRRVPAGGRLGRAHPHPEQHLDLDLAGRRLHDGERPAAGVLRDGARRGLGTTTTRRRTTPATTPRPRSSRSRPRRQGEELRPPGGSVDRPDLDVGRGKANREPARTSRSRTPARRDHRSGVARGSRRHGQRHHRGDRAVYFPQAIPARTRYRTSLHSTATRSSTRRPARRYGNSSSGRATTSCRCRRRAATRCGASRRTPSTSSRDPGQHLGEGGRAHPHDLHDGRLTQAPNRPGVPSGTPGRSLSSPSPLAKDLNSRPEIVLDQPSSCWRTWS